MARSLVVLFAGQAVLDRGQAGFVVDLDNVGGPTKGGGGSPDADARVDIGSEQFFDRRRGPVFQGRRAGSLTERVLLPDLGQPGQEVRVP